MLNTAIINKIRKELIEYHADAIENESNAQIKKIISDLLSRALLEQKISMEERVAYMEHIFNAIRGLGILQGLMDNKYVSEIMVNRYDRIFYESDGKLYPTDLSFDSREQLQTAITQLFSKYNKSFNLLNPIVDGRLDDGSRAHAVLYPIAVEGPTLNIRKFSGFRQDAMTLIDNKSITLEAINILKTFVETKKTLMICGGTGSGKTTLLNILSGFIPTTERIITIEDSAELQIQNISNLVRLEARPGTAEGQGEVSIDTLIRSSLRMRPDRIIVGEVRGDEAYMLIQAANTGHPGTLSTGHANSCADMLNRLSNMIISVSHLPYLVVARNIVSALDYLIEIRRLPSGQRRVMEITQLQDYKENQFILKPIFLYDFNADRLMEVIHEN